MPLRLLLSDIDGTLAHPRRALDAAGCALEARAARVLLRELPPRALRPLPPSSTGQVRALCAAPAAGEASTKSDTNVPPPATTPSDSLTHIP